MSPFDNGYHSALAALAIALAAVNYCLYIRGILRGTIRPHMFSWAIWALIAGISFAAQWAEQAGPGMWQTLFMTVGTGVIAAFAYLRGDRNYTRTDWTALASALLAIPLWVATSDPLWSVILITGIDIVACWPTIRKSWLRPYEESSFAFFQFGIICGLGFLSLTNLTWTTGLYQGAISLINFAIAAMILARRRMSLPING